MSDKKIYCIESGSIIGMLEGNGVCYFKQEDGKVIVGAGDDNFNQSVLYPEMLRHLANELNEMADKLEER